MEEQAVATEARGNAGDGLRRDAELASDLTEARAAQEPMRDRKQELGQLRPVAGAKRLFGEVTPAVTALESLDAVWVRAAQEESCTDAAPRSRWLGVEWAGWVGAERGRRVNRRCGHAVGHCKLQAFRNLLSTTHSEGNAAKRSAIHKSLGDQVGPEVQNLIAGSCGSLTTRRSRPMAGPKKRSRAQCRAAASVIRATREVRGAPTVSDTAMRATATAFTRC